MAAVEEGDVIMADDDAAATAAAAVAAAAESRFSELVFEYSLETDASAKAALQSRIMEEVQKHSEYWCGRHRSHSHHSAAITHDAAPVNALGHALLQAWPLCTKQRRSNWVGRLTPRCWQTSSERALFRPSPACCG